MTSNNSANKIQIGDNGLFYTGDIHLSRYKDPNDDLTELNDSIKELFNQDYEETYDGDSNSNKLQFARLTQRFNNNSNHDNIDLFDKAIVTIYSFDSEVQQ
jgi:hypothetical protein